MMNKQKDRACLCHVVALLVCATAVRCQLNFTQIVDELAANGKLPNATQTVAGYTAQTLCSGAFVSQRSFDSVWNNDVCLYNCLVHTIFNLTNPQHSYGKFAINNASKYVNVSVLDSSTSAVFSGDRFGCQLSLANQTRVVPKYADNARRPASNVWKDATMNSSNAISGVDYVKLNATLARYFEDSMLVEKAKTQAIVVIYKGQLIAEMYSGAMDINPDTPLVSWSLAKSVTSAVVGVRTADADMNAAFSQSQLATTPAWNASEAAARNITVDDLMRMVSGIDWNEGARSLNSKKGVPVSAVGEMLYEAQDGAAFVGALPQNATPGRYYNYSTGNYQVVQYNLRKSFGGNNMHYWSYAYNKVFKKIGATSFSFEADPSGTLFGGSSAYMTPRDWARFGQLYLQGGKWNDEQILPPGWVEYSTTPTPAYTGYGAGWWLQFPGAPAGTFYGNGLLGQRVIVVPAMDMVIARMGLNFLDDFDQVYGRDFFTGIAACIPANATSQGEAIAARGLSQTVEVALGDSPTATVQS